MNELFTVNENGQLEVDFDNLILKTCVEMVSEIKKDLEDIDTKIVTINESKTHIQVIVSNKYEPCVSIYSYCKYDNNSTGYDWYTLPKNLIMDCADKLRGDL